ncbi:MAG: aminotransferase class V-fold PLP-dependent enzyme [Anaerolineae bacterium]
MSPSTSTTARTPAPTLASLGVRPLINAEGTYTRISGSRVLPQVAEAMLDVTGYYVDMDILMERVGARLAEITGAPWGYVSNGCAAALVEIAAACITGGDPEKMARLPDTQGMPHQIVMQTAHRNGYDRAFRAAGGEIVEVVTAADLRAAIGPRTAMLAITGDLAHLGQITVPEMIAIGHAHGVPCLVDAAAERPDVPNCYLAMGADAVAYSGGKGLRGPQSSGLVLGRKELLRTAYLNGCPHGGLARPMKAGKEEIMGLLAAVEAWVLGRDHAAEWRAWEAVLEHIADAVVDLPTVRTEVRQPGIANVAPTLYVTWDRERLGWSPQAVREALLEGDPAIAINLRDEGLLVTPTMLEAGEGQVVARRLAEVLHASAPPSPQPPALPALDLAGSWAVRLRYTLSESLHRMVLRQDGDTLQGSYCTPYRETEVSGRVEGKQVTLRVRLGFESNTVGYAFVGGPDDGQTPDSPLSLAGQVDVDDYGQAAWQATREA